MNTNRDLANTNKSTLRMATIALATIFVVTLILVIFSLILQGNFTSILSSPIRWFNELDSSISFDIVSTVAELLAAILAIAITVVAIVVELAANRYSHRITPIFVREPVNIVVMSFFVVATIYSIWIALTLEANVESATVLNAGLLISMLMATTSLIILLPYFAYVMSFLSPENIILKIQNSGLNYVKNSGELPLSQAKKGLLNAIDELQDIARRSVELSDRAVEMASINALLNIILSYQDLVKNANEQTRDWSKVEEVITNDPDFISLSAAALRRINNNHTWVEVKILRQYLDLVSDSNPSARDTSYLIAINTRRIAIESLETRNDLELVDLCIRCFNSYLRATINNNDPRTGYYVMNQYRILAEELLVKGQNAPVRDIVLHLKFYGILGFQKEQPFLLEVAAEDTALLASRCIRTNPVILDELLTQLLQLDQEIKEEYQEDSLLGVRRAQVKLAAALLQAGDANRATLIIDDLKDEDPERLIRLIKNLKSEDRDEYWEFTDRGVNFAYLDPELRNYLDQIRDQIIT